MLATTPSTTTTLVAPRLEALRAGFIRKGAADELARVTGRAADYVGGVQARFRPGSWKSTRYAAEQADVLSNAIQRSGISGSHPLVASTKALAASLRSLHGSAQQKQDQLEAIAGELDEFQSGVVQAFHGIDVAFAYAKAATGTIDSSYTTADLRSSADALDHDVRPALTAVQDAYRAAGTLLAAGTGDVDAATRAQVLASIAARVDAFDAAYAASKAPRTLQPEDGGYLGGFSWAAATLRDVDAAHVTATQHLQDPERTREELVSDMRNAAFEPRTRTQDIDTDIQALREAVALIEGPEQERWATQTARPHVLTALVAATEGTIP